MRKLFALGAALAVASSVYAAPNATNNTQKGSAFVLPDIIAFDSVRINPDGSPVFTGATNTIINISNDGTAAIDVKCYWMDANKNRLDFMFSLTKNQTVWFDARTGDGSVYVNPMPYRPSNGLAGVAGKGLLACWAVDASGQNRVKWNHLYATATVFNQDKGSAYEYTAYSFFHLLGNEGQIIGEAAGPGNGSGKPGELPLTGAGAYDQCPLYMVGAFHPAGYTLQNKDQAEWFFINRNRLAVAGCNLDLRQDYTPTYTKLQFDVWDARETKLTGGYKCADSWAEVVFPDLDAGSQVLTKSTVDTDKARFRVQGIKSTQCPRAVDVGIVVVQSTELFLRGGIAWTGTNLTAGGKTNGLIQFDPADPVFEGRIR